MLDFSLKDKKKKVWIYKAIHNSKWEHDLNTVTKTVLQIVLTQMPLGVIIITVVETAVKGK